MTETISGIVAYPVTPFTADDTVAVGNLHTIIDRLIAGGADAVAPLGSTGESAYLDEDEWDTVAAASVDRARGRVPTVVGVSALTTDAAVRRARKAERLGATAVMALPTSYWRLTEEEVRQHFMALAGAISIPVMVYNNPATTGIDMSPEFLFGLVDSVDNITMVKESSGDITRMHRLRELSGATLPFFNGSNPLAYEAFSAGAAGWCTAAACLVPETVAEFHRAITSGREADAHELFERLRPFLDMIVSRALPTTIKSGLHGLGLDAGTPRQPLLPLSEAEAAQLQDLIKACAAG